MKKLISTLLALMMLLSPVALNGATALADEAVELDGDIMTVADGVTELPEKCLIDLNGDGEEEEISYSFVGDEYDDGTMTVNVGDESLDIELYSGIDALYAGRLGGDNDVIYLMVGEYGMSSDYCTYVMRYDENGLKQIGGIEALPEELKLNGDSITASVRGNKIQTWYRESDFVIARELRYDEDYNMLPENYYVAEVPRTYYAMNTVVILKCDVTVKKSLFGTGTEKLNKGDKVVLSATDDNSYVYLDVISSDTECTGGYMMLDEDSLCGVIVDGEVMQSYDVFDGVLMAD